MKLDRLKRLVQASTRFLRMYQRTFRGEEKVAAGYADLCEKKLVEALRPYVSVKVSKDKDL